MRTTPLLAVSLTGLAGLAAAAGLAGCGPKPKPTPIPVLPTDGDRNVAKPPAPVPVAADPWAGKTDLIALPVINQPGPIELPQIDEFKLANGLQVYVVKSDRLPVISMQLAVRAGRMHEPFSRLGVAELTANMLVRGSARRDGAALARAIDFVGGTIGADSTFEATLVSCSALIRSASTCYELLPEIVVRPAFPEAELIKARDQMAAAVRSRLADAGTLASANVQNLLWGPDHVRGWINSDTSVLALKREDLLAWHKAWFVPNNAMIVVAGDVDAKRVKTDLERAFGGWAKSPVPPTPSYPAPGLSGSRIRLIDRPGLPVTQIRIAQYGIQHDDPRFFDTMVWNYILGGTHNSRLSRAAASTGSRLYGASSSFDRNLDKGSFVTSLYTRNADAVAATKSALAEIAKMDKDGPTRDEVAGAIANIVGGYGGRFQAAQDVGAAVLGAELHGFGREYLTNFPVVIGRVDPESAKRTAQEVLDPKGYVIAMVGDAKDLEPALKKEGWRYQKVSFSDPISPPPRPAEAQLDPKTAADARKIAEDALAAKGGKARLAALKGFRMLAQGTTTIRGQTVPVEIERLLVLPDKMRIDATLAQRVKVIVAVSGKTGWQLAPDDSGQKQQLTDVGAADVASIEFERWREPELILLRAADPKSQVATAPDEAINGKPQTVIKLRSPFSGGDIVLYLDKGTKLLTRMVYSEGGATETDDFSDYKEVSGVKVAHGRLSSGPQRTTKLELKTVELDPKYDPKLWDRPAPPPK